MLLRSQAALGVFAALLFGTTAADAAPVFDLVGISNPADTITFDENVFTPGHVLTYQYSDHGVQFSPNLVFGFPQNDPPVSGNLLRNFFPNGNGPFQGAPFAVKFDDVQTRAAFALNMVPGTVELIARRNGQVVESFSQNVANPGASRFVGFTGITFDEIIVNPGGPTQTVLLDNIQLGVKAPIVHNQTGLANPSRVITFDEHIFAPGTILTNQYADLGVRFSPNIVYGLEDSSGLFLPVTGNLVRNFFPNNDLSVFEGLDPFSIEFEEDQQEAAFALNTGAGKVTITALLDGVVVRTFSSEVVDPSGDTLYYGFSGITFDEILIDAPGDKGTILLDNIQFGPRLVAVAEPASMALFGSALLALAGGWRRRPRAAAA
jgi:hypothetical protein